MKVLQINKFYYLKGGAEKHFLDLIDLLSESGVEVPVFSMQDKKNLATPYAKYFADPVNLEKFSVKDSLKYFRNWDAIKKLRWLIKEQRPDIAHLHNIAHQLTPAIIHVLKENNIPVIQTLHDYKLICPNYRLFTQNSICYRCRGKKYYNSFKHRCIDGRAAKSFLAMCEMYYNDSWHKYYELVDLFIAPSRFMRDICVSFGIPKDKIIVLNNFIDGRAYRPAGARDRAGDYLLYFGRLAYEKGVGTIIEAIAQANRSAKLKIVGSGPEEKNYPALIKKYKLGRRVELVGPKYGRELQDIIRRARAVIVPSLWNENWPFSVLEAMALGKVVIGSSVGGIPEMLSGGKRGLLFEPGDSRSLADLIDSVYDNAYPEMGVAARAGIGQYDPGNYLRSLNKIYQGLIKK